MTTRNKQFYEGMSELEELAGGVLAIPVPEEEREAVFEETRKAIELMKQGKWVSPDGTQPFRKA